MAKPPPSKVVSLLDSELSEMSRNERLKADSQGLFWVAGKRPHSFREEVESLARGEAANLGNEAKEISKHFGVYKQQARVEGRKTGSQILMLRLKVPAGGEFSAAQWNAICEASDRFADGSLRLTTRQGVQFHHVAPAQLGELVRFLKQDYPRRDQEISTLGACGDVNRNTMCGVADDLDPELPLASRELAFRIASELAPQSSAYYQIFLTDELGRIEQALEPEEPLYGPQYLPRKFKVGIAHPRDNSVDLLTQDVGFLPVVENGAVARQYDLYSGGGLGTTHGMPHTRALLGLYLGRVPREQVVDATRAILILQKENGERKDRRQARWKYTIRRLGVDAVRAALRERFELELRDADPQPLPPNRFFHGWHEQHGGKLFLGIPVANGRVRNADGVSLRSAVGEIASELDAGVRVTGNQDLVIAHIPAERRDWVDALLERRGVPPAESVSTFRRQAFGCPALPTCGLAMTHAEHAIPGLADAVEQAGLGDADVVLRMAGCPNHCSRPPSAEIGITGYGKNAHMIRVGGSREGTRLAEVLYEKVGSEQLVPVLTGLLRAIRDHNPDGLPPGDFLQQTPPDKLREWVGVQE